MYINWFHEYIPKVNAILSFFINSLLAYVVLDEKKLKLGNYRFLLLFFAIFNLMSTVGDCLVPFCVLDHKYSFSVFVSGGFFEKKSMIGTIFLALRCGFISAAYGILHCHFVYRYMALFMTKVLNHYFLPYGMMLTVFYCSLPLTLWAYISYQFMDADDERRAYLATSFRETYHADVFDMNLLIAQYDEGTPFIINKSWFGILVVTTISSISFATDLILGYLITRKLRTNIKTMSQKTRRMQQQFMKALWVQVTIPIFVSFLPCMFAWYRPVFSITIAPWVDETDTVATSFFAVIDPLALFYFIPTFNKRVREIFRFPMKVDEEAENKKKRQQKEDMRMSTISDKVE